MLIHILLAIKALLKDIINIETWCNSLPRKILAYHTPDEIFEKELDRIYQTA